jgi:preprotein translocase subunit SecY
MTNRNEATQTNPTNTTDACVMIPQSAHELDMAREERHSKRLWIVIIILIVCLVGSNVAWIIYESQFQDVVITQEGDTDSGGSNYFNGTGEMSIYGEGKTDDQNPR